MLLRVEGLLRVKGESRISLIEAREIFEYHALVPVDLKRQTQSTDKLEGTLCLVKGTSAFE
jgi:hypothetical protein